MKKNNSLRTAGNSAIGMIVVLVIVIIIAAVVIALVGKNRRGMMDQNGMEPVSQDSSTATLEAELGATNTSSLDSEYNSL